MATIVHEKIKSLPPQQRKAVEELAAKLIAEEFARRKSIEKNERTIHQKNHETGKVESLK